MLERLFNIIHNEKEDKIISKMTAKTHDNSVWSNGNLGDYSKMDERVELINKISEMILKQETNFNEIKNTVKTYDILLEETIRNFYELKQDSEIPLFELCEFIELGKDNYCMDDEEYDERVSELIESVNDMFEVNLIRE